MAKAMRQEPMLRTKLHHVPWYPHLPNLNPMRWGPADLRRARIQDEVGIELGDRVAARFFYGDDHRDSLWPLRYFIMRAEAFGDVIESIEMARVILRNYKLNQRRMTLRRELELTRKAL